MLSLVAFLALAVQSPLPPSLPQSPLAEARSLVGAGKFPAAETIVRSQLKIRPDSAEAHFLLGYILFKQQKAESSLAEYTAGAKYHQPSARDLEVVASDYILLKDYPDADKWYTKAVEWSPDDELAWYYLGRTKYNENRFDEAVTIFQKCLTLKPRDVKAEDNLGLSYQGLNKNEEAIAAFRTAISWQTVALEKNPDPYLNLGTLLVDTDQASEGLPHLLEAAKLAPSDFRMRRALGKTYLRLDRPAKARDELETAAKLAPTDAPIRFMLAQVYRKLGLPDQAKAATEMYTQLTARQNDHP
jgi:Flp pilus assembly protein TadD